MRMITYPDVLNDEEKYIFVDVRTPSEFNNSTIPGAVNVPLLSDEQHKIVGTAYKREGRRVATKIALKLFGPSLVDIYEKFEELACQKKDIVIFCARGGMRSSTLVSFLQTLAIPVVKLDFGYKGYRRYVINNLEKYVESKTFITLYGNTGVGKTNILKKLAIGGFDILDLEACANHRGSLLGHVGLGVENSQRMFESLVFDCLRRSGKVVFTEGESKRIGKVIMPSYLYDKVHNSHQVVLETTLENRVENIKKEYISVDNLEENILAVKKLDKYVPSKVIDSYVSSLENGEYDLVISSLITDYYDKKYRSTCGENAQKIRFITNCEVVDSLSEIALLLNE